MLWGGWRRYRRVALGAAAVWALGSSAPADAVLKFGPARTLTPAGTIAFRPHVAYDSQEQATVAWTIYPNNPSCPLDACRTIQAVRLSSSGVPATIHTLSPSVEDAIESDAQVTVDSQARATVVWEAQTGANYQIEAARIGADGSPGPARTLSAPGGDGTFPKVAIDSQDRVTVVWSRNNGSAFQVQALRIAADGTLGAVRTLSPPGGDAVDPALAIDSQDRVTIVWTQFDGAQYRAEQVRLDSLGNPGTVHTLSAAGGNVSLPQVAVDSLGRARVVWTWDPFVFGGTNIALQTALLDSSEVEGPVRVLDPSIAEGALAQLAVDSHGSARAVWEAQLSAALKTRTVGADGSLGAVRSLASAQVPAGQPQIAFDSRGRAVITFFSGQWIRVVRFAPDGTPGALQTVSAAGDVADHPQLAIDSQDRVMVAWEMRDLSDASGTLRVQVARGQAVPPGTRITRGPGNGSAILSHTVKFSFTGVPSPFSGSLECSVDGRPFIACSAPFRVKGLRDGHHSFRVRAADEDGVDASPAVRRFVEIGSCMAKARRSGHLAGARRRCRAKVG